MNRKTEIQATENTELTEKTGLGVANNQQDVTVNVTTFRVSRKTTHNPIEVSSLWSLCSLWLIVFSIMNKPI